MRTGQARRMPRKAVLRLPTRRSKYGAVKTTVDGIVFHSAKEARRYGELKLLEKAGEIQALELQPVFGLHCGGQCGGSSECLGRYVADFRYVDARTCAVVIEDVKGFKTPLYRWKKKHVMAQYNIEIRET